MKAHDLTGQEFGRLTPLEVVGRNAHRSVVWRCLCACGTEVDIPSNSLRSGNTRSCGCMHRQSASERATARNAREVIGYTGAHRRVIRVRGAAKDQTCTDCGERAEEWSYTHDDPDAQTDDLGRAFSPNPDFYVPRCRSCHRHLDSRLASARRSGETEGATQ